MTFRSLRLGLVLPLAACPPFTGLLYEGPGIEPPKRCAAQFDHLAVAACFEGPGAEPADSAGTAMFSVDWTGTVEEIGTGFPDTCSAARFGDGAEFIDGEPGRWWARITTDAGDACFGISTPGSAAPAVGREVRVRAAYVPGDGGPKVASVEVSADGDLVAWVGEAATPEDLTAPAGFALTTGEAVCSDSDGCGSWSWYDLDVAAPCGTLGPVEPGAEADACGRTISLSDFQHADGASTCPDGFVADVVVGIAE